MIKKILIVFVFLVLILPSISYASENGGNEDTEIINQTVDTPPVIIKSVKPDYPSKLRGRYGEYYEGKVTLRFVVTKEGDVIEPEVSESIPSGVFDEYALEAIKQYRFKPAQKNGAPVDSIVILPIEFSLRDTITGYDIYTETEEGHKYIETGEYDKAIETFSESIKIYSQNSACYLGRGLAYMLIGEYQKSLKDINRAIEINPEKGNYYNLRGKIYYLLEYNQRAIEDYSKAIKMEPDKVEPYNNRGDIYREMGKYKEAIQDYTKVISLDENYIQAYNNRGYSYNKLNDMKNTCIDLEKACELGDCLGLDILHKAGRCLEAELTPTVNGGL